MLMAVYTKQRKFVVSNHDVLVNKCSLAYWHSTLYATHNSQFQTTNTNFSRKLNTNTLPFYWILWGFIALDLQLASFDFITYFSLFLIHHFCSHSIHSPFSRWRFSSKPPLSVSLFYRLDKLFRVYSKKWGLCSFPRSFHPASEIRSVDINMECAIYAFQIHATKFDCLCFDRDL